MMRPFLLGALTFGVCAALGAATPACVFNDCECPATPAFPEAEAGLTVTSVLSFDDQGNDVPLAFDPDHGTVDVGIGTVVIRYESDGDLHEIVYRVTGPR